jgi:diguanylate cyclase (GGDEF)-like protein
MVKYYNSLKSRLIRHSTRQSMFRSLAIAISLGVIVVQTAAMTGNLNAETAAVEQAATKRAEASLDMLASVHTQSMLNRKGTDDNDGAIATLNGTMEQFSKSNDHVKLWMVMGPKIVAFQKANRQNEIELPRDQVDNIALQTGEVQSTIVKGKLRQTRPIIFGQGAAAADACGSCHADKMGTKLGEVMGAYSAAVDMAPENATWWTNAKREMATTFFLTLAVIAMMLFLLRQITLRPLGHLARSTNQLANGALDVEITGDDRPDEIGDMARSLKIFRDDLSDKRALEAQNLYRAQYDEMTGLANRSTFMQQLQVEVESAAAQNQQVAVIGIDLNRFKEINDRHGHAIGDGLLVQLAKRVTRGLDDGEFVSRFGGDEFVAAKRFTLNEELDEFIDRMEAAMLQPIKVDQLMLTPGASLGVAIYPSDAETAAQLVANADLAMYRAKADPNANVGRYEAAMDERARERRALSIDLRTALRNGQFKLHYQQQNSIETGEIFGYEALLRWTHPVLGSVAPDYFIPIAEENGEIIPIGEWVLRTACAEAACWNNDMRIAVNLSAIQLGQGDLARRVHEILLETGLSPRRLELEITETAIVADKDRALGTLRMIKALGVSVALDDFGAGYSSLATLHAFPFDKIKMDRAFIWEADKRPESRAIIRAIIAIGHSLNVPVLAEGVETENQRALLLSEGCLEAQGYLFGKPRPETELAHETATSVASTATPKSRKTKTPKVVRKAA